MADDRKTIAVVGATGAQGGGLARAILADQGGPFRARAITRDPKSPKAQELARAGAEVVAGDVDDLESLKKAFAGAYGAFCVTPFWAHFSAEKEMQEAKNCAEAAKHAKLQHVIWSTLEDTRKTVPLSDDRMPTLQGKWKVPHFDAKGEADQYFAQAGVPTTYLLASFYWENFIHFGSGPKKGPDGTYLLTFPIGKAKMAGIAAEDIGKAAYAIFKGGKKYVGQRVGIAGEHLTGDEMAAAMSKAVGVEIRYNEVTPEAYRAFGFPGAEDVGNMFQFYRDFESQVNTTRNVPKTRELVPDLQDLRTWLSKYGKQIPLD